MNTNHITYFRQIAIFAGVSVLLTVGGCASSSEQDEQNYKILDDDPSQLQADPDPTPGSAVREISPYQDEHTDIDTTLEQAETTASTQTIDTAIEPATDSTSEPAIEPDSESDIDIESDIKYAMELTIEPSIEPSIEPAIEPAVDHTIGPVIEINIKPSIEPSITIEYTTEPVKIKQTRPEPDRPSLRGISRSHWQKITTGPASGRTNHNPYYFKDLSLLPSHKVDLDLPRLPMRIQSALVGARANNWSSASVGGIILQPINFVFNGAGMLIQQPLNPAWSKQSTPKKERRIKHPSHK